MEHEQGHATTSPSQMCAFIQTLARPTRTTRNFLRSQSSISKTMIDPPATPHAKPEGLLPPTHCPARTQSVAYQAAASAEVIRMVTSATGFHARAAVVFSTKDEHQLTLSRARTSRERQVTFPLPTGAATAEKDCRLHRAKRSIAATRFNAGRQPRLNSR